MKATRRTQPFRKGARAASKPLQAMQKGTDAFGKNPLANNGPRRRKRKGALRKALMR